jgi:tetratricopeptide (TPR) repeat protein
MPWKPVLDKLPLLALVAGSCVATFVAQRSGQSMTAIDVLPLGLRVGNAIVAYTRYLVMMVWPAGLAVFYPHPGPALPAWQVLLSLVTLLAISGAAAFWGRQRPYLLVGWLWYLGALVPVIGIAQVGAQALADRYTYVPLIGLFIAISWGVPELAGKVRLPRWSPAVGGTAILAALSVCAFFQVSYWRNSITLMTHALNVTSGNYLAHKNLGVALAAQKRYEEAIVQYVAGIRIKPNDPDLYYNLGNALAHLGKTDDAIAWYLKALAIKPDHTETRYNLGNAYARQGRFNDAIAQYVEVLKRQPDNLDAHINLGTALVLSKRPEEAMRHYQEALRIDPNNVESLTNLGNVLVQQNKYDDAVSFYSKAIGLDPNNAVVYENLGAALMNLDRRQEAAEAFSQVLRIDPGNARARENLRLLTGRSGPGKQGEARSPK